MRGEERDGETERRRDKGTEREGEGLVVNGEWRVSTLKHQTFKPRCWVLGKKDKLETWNLKLSIYPSLI